MNVAQKQPLTQSTRIASKTLTTHTYSDIFHGRGVGRNP